VWAGAFRERGGSGSGRERGLEDGSAIREGQSAGGSAGGDAPARSAVRGSGPGGGGRFGNPD
jgi:hypothetical protein